MDLKPNKGEQSKQPQQSQKPQNDVNKNANSSNDKSIENGAQKPKNREYYNEKGQPKYEEIVQYLNNIRNEIELTTPLISTLLPITHLIYEFSNSEYENSISLIKDKYSHIRTTRRDGNCFYRGYLYRLFEELGQQKSKSLYNKLIKMVEGSKKLTEEQGYSWIVIEDFYNSFLEELKNLYIISKDNIQGYLDKLFGDKERSNYLIVYVRLLIAAYLKQNKILYEAFIEDEFESWVQREVEVLDNECDQVQIMAIVNAFDIGVIIEYLSQNSVDRMKFPEEGGDVFIHLLFRPGHYDILYPNDNSK